MDDGETGAKAIFAPIVAAWQWIVSLKPSNFRWGKPRLNFINVHYLFIIGSTIACSIIIFGNNYMTFINAIFFAAGSSTQSGLNPINLNDLYLYQQVTLMLFACVTNPIFINTVVVFVRLYWFEKRFAKIVEESREARKSKSRISRTRSQMAADHLTPERLEMGVRGRRIRVLHETTHPNGMSGTTAGRNTDAQQEFAEKMGLSVSKEPVEPSSGSESGTTAPIESGSPRIQSDSPSLGEDADGSKTASHFHRDIIFADELPSPVHERAKEQQESGSNDFSKHIAFLEKQQRDATDGVAIRIPGPRDFDRGELPQALSSEKDGLHQLSTMNTNSSAPRDKALQIMDSADETAELNGDDHHERGGITFEDQEHPGHRDRNADERPTTSASHPNNHEHRGVRSRRSKASLNDARETISRTLSAFTTARTRDKIDSTMPYLSYEATLGRNSAFLSLTAEQREELGGIEYRALKTLAKVLILYYVGFHVLGLLIYLPWIIYTPRWRSVVVSDGINPGWWGVFTPASAFTDLGFTLTPDSMNSFNESVLALLFGSFLIIIGNTGFPVMLRFVIWLASIIVPYGSATWEELRFLLDHPRRCFTLLFPSKATWWLFWILVLLNGIDLVFYIILDINVSVVDDVAPGYRVLDGWFQAASTRTAGFSCVNVAELHPAIQVSYMVMMYISIFPIAISVRRTNVYEEKSLGVWGGEEVADETDPSYVPQHLRRQLSFDLWYIFLGFFIICIVEGSILQNNDYPSFTMFAVLFEVVSAYGTVGLSLGYPNTDTSFSAQFHVISKLVIIAMMIRGRHRGLPYALDRAILLPSENLEEKEQEDSARQFARRGSVFAESNGAHLTNPQSWSDYELDENGLPKQHDGRARPNSSAIDDALLEGAIGDRRSAIARTVSRRGSGLSTTSRNERAKTRGRSLSRFIAGGLSAGPTMPKQD